MNFLFKILGYDNIKKKIITVLDKIITKYPNKNILLLGRYKNDVLKINNKLLKYKNKKIIYTKFPNIDITYMTIHASKGLGFDNVVIINNLDCEYGFPSKVKNDKFKQIFVDDSENINEERLLFYVALTRTKNSVIILTKKNKESCFAKELYNYENVLCNYKMKHTKRFKT